MSDELPWPDDEDERPVHEVYRDGAVHVLADKCHSCIFRSVNDGRITGLHPGRVAGMVLDARADENCIPCHTTIWEGDGVKAAICRGYWDLPHRPAILDLAVALGRVVYDPPPEE